MNHFMFCELRVQNTKGYQVGLYLDTEVRVR